MSKNITIQEGGVAKQLTVDKLKTNIEENGTKKWIPEENIGVKALKVTRNGTYTAEEMDVFGFDMVEVSVSKHGGQGAETIGNAHTGDLTTHNPAIMEGGKARTMGGASRLKVDKTGGGTLMLIAENDLSTGNLYADTNRVYVARRDGLYAYTSVNVNVDISGGGGDDPYAPENLPKYIAGGPLQIAYSDGDTIRLQNGDVIAYKEIMSEEGRNTPWTSPEYPNGVIPTSELSWSPRIAEFEGDAFSMATSPLVTSLPQPIAFTDECWLKTSTWGYIGVKGDAAFFSSKNQNGGNLICIAKSPNNIYYKVGGDYKKPASSIQNVYTYNGKTVYMYSYSVSYQTVLQSYGIDYTGQNVDGPSMWTMLYGNIEPGYEQKAVAISWPRPVDGQVLSHTSYIMVYPAGTDLGYGGPVVGSGGTQQ